VSAAHAPEVRRIQSDASVHQIWVIDASARIGALPACVLPRGCRARLAAAQRVGAMLVKGWTHRLAFCYATPSLRSMLWHWKPAAPPNAWRCHFNAGAWASALASNAIRSF
jgi:hypothetical protein